MTEETLGRGGESRKSNTNLLPEWEAESLSELAIRVNDLPVDGAELVMPYYVLDPAYSAVFSFVNMKARRLAEDTNNSGGYPRVKLKMADGSKRNFYIHELACSYWHGRRPPGHEVDHADGNRRNNGPQNLSWVEAPENARRRHRRSDRLTEEQVQAVRELNKLPTNLLSKADIAKASGLERGRIGDAANKRTFAKVPEIESKPGKLIVGSVNDLTVKEFDLTEPDQNARPIPHADADIEEIANEVEEETGRRLTPDEVRSNRWAKGTDPERSRGRKRRRR